MPKPTEKQVQDILDTGLFFDELQWTDAHEGFIFSCSSEQQWNAEVVITLKGTINHKTGYYKWQLHYNPYRIVALENGHNHHNPTCNTVGAPHFHMWKEGYRCIYAEYVDFPESDNVLRGLYWLLRECNVRIGKMPGNPPEYREQRRLLI